MSWPPCGVANSDNGDVWFSVTPGTFGTRLPSISISQPFSPKPPEPKVSIPGISGLLGWRYTVDLSRLCGRIALALTNAPLLLFHVGLGANLFHLGGPPQLVRLGGHRKIFVLVKYHTRLGGARFSNMLRVISALLLCALLMGVIRPMRIIGFMRSGC